MKKTTIKKIINFRSRSPKAKQNFANDLKLDKATADSESSGGDYWVSCLSAISNCFKSGDPKYIISKIEELEAKLEDLENEGVKTRYRRNIDILSNYEDIDPKKWKPAKKIIMQKKHKEDTLLTIKGLQVQISPQYVFTFQKNDVEEIGAIWFIAQLKGFRKEELGMFTDILYRYLKTHYSKKYTLNAKFCIAEDVFNKLEVNYAQLEKEEIPFLLNTTLDEIKKLM